MDCDLVGSAGVEWGVGCYVDWDILANLSRRRDEKEQRTLTKHIPGNIKLRDIIRWRRLNPHTLPDPTTRRIEDMTRSQRLFANWDNKVPAICRIMNEDQAIPTFNTQPHSNFGRKDLQLIIPREA